LRNFQEIADELEKNKALLLIEENKELAKFFTEMISNPKKKEKTGNASFEVFQKNRGVLKKIKESLDIELKKYLS
ncbi:MAG: hypothetical protein CMD85_00005, partial [Gammaproteobacteria bacterium]|nr:hypothetical protein [Gammaproteobacteria bacterium]